MLQFVVIALVVGVASGAHACVGARPLSMGGAFVGLADDANATYWNPAGLVQLEQEAGTSMHTATNRGAINYQDYLAVAAPVGGNAAVGVSWIRFNLPLDLQTVDEQDWYWASLAMKVGRGTSIGVNIMERRDSIPGVTTEMGIDVGLFARVNDQWSVGLLVQNANEPEMSDGDDSIPWVRNWRPGFAYRPDASSVASVELYDATNNGGAQSLRVGYEKKLKDGWAARLGYYGLGLTGAQAVTVGVGRTPDRRPDGTLKGIGFDFTGMLGDIETIVGSITVNY